MRADSVEGKKLLDQLSKVKVNHAMVFANPFFGPKGSMVQAICNSKTDKYWQFALYLGGIYLGQAVVEYVPDENNIILEEV